MTASIVGYTAKEASAASGTSFTLDVPAETLSGDLLLAFLISPNVVWTPPAGWLLITYANGVARYRRTATNAEPATYTFTQASSTAKHGYIVAIRGATYSTISPLGASATPSVAASTVVRASDSIIFDLVATLTTAGVTYSTPTGYTPLATANGASAMSSALFHRFSADVGATGTVSSTPSGGSLARSALTIVASSPLEAAVTGVGGSGSVGDTLPAGAVRIAAINLQGLGLVGNVLVWGVVQTGSPTTWTPITTSTLEVWALVDSTQNPGWTG